MIRTDRSKVSRLRALGKSAVLSLGLAGAALLLAAPHANALTVTQVGPDSGPYNVSDSVSLTYFVNNIGDPGLAVMAFTVQYDNTILTHVQAAGSVKNKIFSGAVDEEGNNPGYVGSGLIRITKTPFEPNADEVSFNWQSGTSPTWGEVSNQLLGTAVFMPIANGFNSMRMANGQGSTFLQYAGSYASQGAPSEVEDDVIYRGVTGIWVPEPGVASLSLAAIVSLYAIRARQRR